MARGLQPVFFCAFRCLYRILIHACARIAIRPMRGWALTCRFWFMHVQGLQRVARGNGCAVLIHACARIATLDWLRLIRHGIISIHACAKIATILSKKVIHNVRYFNSCMREDCNFCHSGFCPRIGVLIHACVRIATRRLYGFTRNFDSCMCEDCNTIDMAGLWACSISIHACARIAMPRACPYMDAGWHFDSCMCEDCNTTIVKHDGYARVLIHACAKIATKAREWEEWAAFWFMYVRGLQPVPLPGYGHHNFWFKHARELQPWRHGTQTNFYNFDSCMRENCNNRPAAGQTIWVILIHACARIATIEPTHMRVLPFRFRFMHARGLQLLMDYTIKQVTGTF